MKKRPEMRRISKPAYLTKLSSLMAAMVIGSSLRWASYAMSKGASR